MEGKKNHFVACLYRATLPILKKKIWINKIEELNDPYECLLYVNQDFIVNQQNVVYESYKQSESNPLSKGKFIEKILKIFEKEELSSLDLLKGKHYGIFNLCLFGNEPLMWSYYASSHVGICIKFKLHYNLQQLVSQKEWVNVIKYDNGPALLLARVEYGNEQTSRPFVLNSHTYKEAESDLVKLNNIQEFKDSGIIQTPLDLMFIKSVRRKYYKWIHEGEIRLIALGLEMEKKIGEDEGILLEKLVWPKSNEPILKPEGIILGMRTPSYLRNIIKNSFGLEVKCYETFLQSGSYEVGIKEFK